MSTPYELTASPRDRTGKGAARATRREGMIPAVIYGGNEPPLAIKLPYKELDQRIHAGRFLTTLGTIVVDKTPIRVIARDFQLDPVKDFPLHVDFLRISADAKLTLQIPVHFINEAASPGIKRGGVLNIVRHEVELVCPVDAIPEFLTCDLAGLDINDSVHISAITLPEGVTPTITDRDFTVATIAAPAGVKEEIRAAAEAAAGAPAETPAAAEKKDEG